MIRDEPTDDQSGNKREDDARKKHPLNMKPFLMIGFIHVLCPLQTEYRQIRKQDPVKKEGIVDADPKASRKPSLKVLAPASKAQPYRIRIKTSIPQPFVRRTFLDL